MFKFFILLALLLPMEAFSKPPKLFSTPLDFTTDIKKAYILSFPETRRSIGRILFEEPLILFLNQSICQKVLEEYKLRNKHFTGILEMEGIRYDFVFKQQLFFGNRTGAGITRNYACQFYWRGNSRGDIPAKKSPLYFLRK